MTTDQTIDGVPRELLERLLTVASPDSTTANPAWYVEELRALLDKEVSGDSRAPQHQGEPLKIGSGVTIENIGFGSERERKPYLVFADNGNLTEVNLIDVTLVSRRRTYTVPELEEIGVKVEQPAPVAVVPTCCGSCPGGCPL